MFDRCPAEQPACAASSLRVSPRSSRQYRNQMGLACALVYQGRPTPPNHTASSQRKHGISMCSRCAWPRLCHHGAERVSRALPLRPRDSPSWTLATHHGVAVRFSSWRRSISNRCLELAQGAATSRARIGQADEPTRPVSASWAERKVRVVIPDRTAWKAAGREEQLGRFYAPSTASDRGSCRGAGR